MYWIDGLGARIHRANLDGTQVEDLVTGLGAPHGLALDLDAGKVYWTDRGVLGQVRARIQRTNLDGTRVEDLIIREAVTFGPSFDSPSGLALDLGRGRMYWIDAGLSGKIQRANLDGTQMEDLVTDLVGSPRNLALDPGGDKMYWTDGGTTRHRSRIQRANLDGSEAEVLVTGPRTSPRGRGLRPGAGPGCGQDVLDGPTDVQDPAGQPGRYPGRSHHLRAGSASGPGAGRGQRKPRPMKPGPMKPRTVR